VGETPELMLEHGIDFSFVVYRETPMEGEEGYLFGQSEHLSDQRVDMLLTVTKRTTLDEMLELALLETTVGVAELERPEEVGSLLEVLADSVDLVDQILHTDDTVLTEVLLNDGVIGQRNALLVDLAVSTLVDQLADRLEVGVTVGDEGLDNLQHLNGSLGELDEDTIVDLEETEKLESLALLGINLVDTRAELATECHRRAIRIQHTP
jgi:hypothetical protein